LFPNSQAVACPGPPDSHRRRSPAKLKSIGKIHRWNKVKQQRKTVSPGRYTYLVSASPVFNYFGGIPANRLPQDGAILSKSSSGITYEILQPCRENQPKTLA